MEILLLALVFGVVFGVVYASEKRPKKPMVDPSPDSTGREQRTFDWVIDRVSSPISCNTTVFIRKDAYTQAQAELIDGLPNKTSMSSDDDCFAIGKQEILSDDFGRGADEIKQIADYISRIVKEKYLSHFEEAIITLGFVHEQCIQYQFDKDSKGTVEYFRFPIETIYDTVGDCDCKAILACSIFKQLNYETAFAIMPGHAALAISLGPNTPFANFSLNGRDWFYCESTGTKWIPGELPDSVNFNKVGLQEV